MSFCAVKDVLLLKKKKLICLVIVGLAQLIQYKFLHLYIR